MQRGDIFLADFPFGDRPGMKLRPVLGLSEHVGTGTEVIVAYISSVVPSSLFASDILLDINQPHCQSTRLKVSSVLRLHKIATIHVTNLQRYVGHPSAPLQQAADAKLRVTLTL